jgi:hypothetical protein
MSQDGLDQALHDDGLGDMVVHAGIDAALAFLRHGMGGHGDDGQVGKAGIGTDPVGGLKAVHLGHLQVHQDHVEGIGARCHDGIEGNPAVVGNADRGADALEQATGDLLDFIVFGNEDAQTGQDVVARWEMGAAVVRRRGRRC